jgi:hypothetical protein
MVSGYKEHALQIPTSTVAIHTRRINWRIYRTNYPSTSIMVIQDCFAKSDSMQDFWKTK